MYFKLFFNIKLNKNFNLFRKFPNFLSSKPPIISGNNCKNINMIKNGAVWKTTAKSRNKLLIKLVDQYISSSQKKITILELGASSGQSVFYGIKKKKIIKYFLTDLYLKHYYKKNKFLTMIYSKKESLLPFMAYNQIFIFYSDNKSMNIILNILSFLARGVFGLINFKTKKKPFSLIDNQIKNYDYKNLIIFKEYDILKKWNGSKVNLIIALNLLNKSYFSKRLMQKIILNIYNILKNEDLIFIGENKKKNKISIFKRVNNKFELIKNSGGKVESHDFFLNFRLKQ